MNPVVLTAMIVMFVLLFLRTPVFIVLLSAPAVYFFLTPGLPGQIAAQRVIAGIENIPLLAIPFFVCSGIVMNFAGVTTRILRFAEVLMKKVPGGLAQVNVSLSVLMGGLSGSSLADAAMQSKMLVPEMERVGFSNEFSTVITAVSAILTLLIPPSVAMIIYGSVANVSIGRLFVAGLGPAIFLYFSMMIMVGFISVKRKYSNQMLEDVSLGKVFIHAIIPLMLPIVLIGGIRFGVFTPTEGGAGTVVVAIILSIIYREFTFLKLFKALKETVCTTAAIMMIIGAASAFAWMLTRERIPQQLTEFIVANVGNKYVFLLILNLFLLAIGLIIEGNAAMIVLVPLFVPIARAFGINDIHFGMMFIFNMAIGSLSPPIGTLTFVTCSITKCRLAAFYKECIPFYALLFICLMLLTYVPVFSLAFVNLIYG
ncbi:MAG: TRAP transporter large permease [Spirochaetes bacterium]|nr:TRAP transporter large permease [Spirochaetota bacterium]